MSITVKIANPISTGMPMDNEKMYELFTTETIIDINDRPVTIPKSIGTFSLSQLEAEKANILIRIADIEEKIEAINDMEK